MEERERPFSLLIKKNNEWVERTSGQEAWKCSAIVPLSDIESGYAPVHPAIATIILRKNLNPKRADITGRREYSFSSSINKIQFQCYAIHMTFTFQTQ